MSVKNYGIKEKPVTKTGLSAYGSHLLMLDEGMTEKLNNDKYVVLKDEEGFYVTERNRLDNKLTDAYRGASKEWRDNFLNSLIS